MSATVPPASSGPDAGHTIARDDRVPLRPTSSRLRATPAGRGLLIFVSAALLLSWGAHGVLTLYAAAGLAVVAIVPILAYVHARALRVVPADPVTTFAGEAFPLDVELVNLSPVFAARDVVLIHAGERDDAERPSGYASTIRPRARQRVPTAHRLTRRGRLEHISLVAQTSFPLGLVTCRLGFDLPVDVLVLPRLGTLRNLGALRARRHGLLYQGASDRGDEQEFHGLREWRDGESQRRVHWKLSARRGRLLVREFRGEDIPPVHVILDTRVPARKRTRSGPRRSFEGAVSLAATLVESHLRRSHLVRFTMVVPGSADHASGLTTDRRRGRHALFPILTALADVQAAPLPESPAAGERDFDVAVRRDEVTYVVCAGSSSRIVGLPPDTIVLDVERPETARFFVRARPGAARGVLGARG